MRLEKKNSNKERKVKILKIKNKRRRRSFLYIQMNRGDFTNKKKLLRAFFDKQKRFHEQRRLAMNPFTLTLSKILYDYISEQVLGGMDLKTIQIRVKNSFQTQN